MEIVSGKCDTVFTDKAETRQTIYSGKICMPDSSGDKFLATKFIEDAFISTESECYIPEEPEMKIAAAVNNSLAKLHQANRSVDSVYKVTVNLKIDYDRLFHLSSAVREQVCPMKYCSMLINNQKEEFSLVVSSYSKI